MPEIIEDTTGWTSKMIMVRGKSQALFIAPDGTEYVRATGREKPDALHKPRDSSLATIRLRLYHGSSAERKVAKAKQRRKAQDRRSSTK